MYPINWTGLKYRPSWYLRVLNTDVAWIMPQDQYFEFMVCSTRAIIPHTERPVGHAGVFVTAATSDVEFIPLFVVACEDREMAIRTKRTFIAIYLKP